MLIWKIVWCMKMVLFKCVSVARKGNSFQCIFLRYRILKLFPMISRHCIKLFGKFLKKLLSTWLLIVVRLSINRNHWIFILLNRTWINSLQCISTHGKRFLTNLFPLSIHYLCLFQGLKTGMYYLRTRPAADPIKFTVDKSRIPATIKTDGTIEKAMATPETAGSTEEQNLARRMKQCNVTDENGACLMCSSWFYFPQEWHYSDRLVISFEKISSSSSRSYIFSNMFWSLPSFILSKVMRFFFLVIPMMYN